MFNKIRTLILACQLHTKSSTGLNTYSKFFIDYLK